MPSHPPSWTFALLAAAGGGCVGYEPDAATPAAVASRVAARAGGRFAFGDALAVALARNAELQALAAAARAAGADVAPTDAQVEYRSHSETLAVMLDPVAALGLGPRGAANAELDATAVAAVAALVEGRWRIAAQLAEVFEVERTLRELTVAELAVDADAWLRAGAASPLAAARLRAATARADAERTLLVRARENNEAELRRILGLPAHAAVELEPPAPDWLPERAVTEDELLGRPDLAVAHARFAVADAAFSRAVRDQYPSLMIGPEILLTGDPLELMGVLRLPLAAGGRAEAARARRDAEAARLETAVLAARFDADTAAADLAAARAVAAAAAAALAVSTAALHAALVAVEVEVEVDAFDDLADAATAAMSATMAHREAALGLARVRVRYAAALGWPAVEGGP